jgi:hypothetical protein
MRRLGLSLTSTLIPTTVFATIDADSHTFDVQIYDLG